MPRKKRRSSQNKIWSGLFLLIAVLIGSLFFYSQRMGARVKASSWDNSLSLERSQDSVIARAFENHTSNFFVESSGVVERILPDDLVGSRHQLFIVRLASGQTLLVSHNIDIAPRLDALKTGVRVRFRGEYEWNDKGGVVHWTHRDPAGRKAGGWIEYNGRRYR